MKNNTFETYIQKRGVGVRFPLSEIKVANYVRGQLPKHIEEVLIPDWLKGELVITNCWNEIRIREKTCFLKDYQPIGNQKNCQHNFKIIKQLNGKNPKWKECLGCEKVERV